MRYISFSNNSSSFIQILRCFLKPSKIFIFGANMAISTPSNKIHLQKLEKISKYYSNFEVVIVSIKMAVKITFFKMSLTKLQWLIDPLLNCPLA
jgi:hypothetical protein